MRIGMLLLLIFALIEAASRCRADEPVRQAVGLQRRTPWIGSRITGSPEPPAPYRVERAFPALQFELPVELVSAPGSDRLFLLELDGKIHSFPNRQDVPRIDLMADLKSGRPGLTKAYGLAFHPQFAENRLCYVSYVLADGEEHGTRVSQFAVRGDDPPVLDLDSEQIVITWRSGGHNGACLKFGPDGRLYISTGDGGPAFPPDPLKSGQDVGTLLSAILRIDVDDPPEGQQYRIPSDNPFVDLPEARGEIWSFGFRNPWKMSFDSQTGDLWVGDVGWELWELVYRVRRGGNYGWSVMEGPQQVHLDRPVGPTPILPPTIQHSHIESRSITGGMVYRGSRLPELQGRYIYGDYVTGKIWAADFDRDSGRVTRVEELLDSPLAVITFGVDRRQEMYVVGYGGTIHRLAPNSAAQANQSFPRRLSETGLFESVADHRPAAGVIPYSINAEPWADHATATRLLAVPGDQRIDVHTNNNAQVGELRGQWKFPSDTVLAKTISLEMERGRPASRRRLETQILHYDVDTWRAYTYIWNDQQTDAELAPEEGLERTLTILDREAAGGRRQQTWRFASRTECILCHTTRGGTLYGFKPEQLRRDHNYGGVVAPQLDTLEHIGLFVHPATRPPIVTPPYDASAELDRRARAYLHVNCAHCHQRGGGGTAAIEIQYDRPWDRTRLDSEPTQGTFGILDARIVAPGDPFRSELAYRMAKVGRGRMPHFGSTIVDREGLALIHDWIAQMPRAADAPTDQLQVLRQRQRRELQQLLESDDPQRRKELLGGLLSTISGALQVRHAVDQQLAGEARRQAIDIGAAHEDIRVRDVFESYLPEEQRTKRLGSQIDVQLLLSMTGDAERGRSLFHEAAGMQCRNCHKIGGRGEELGPDLSDIGRQNDRAKLLESLLEPSKKIDPKYVAYSVLTDSGEVHSGLLVERSDERIVLRDSQRRQIRIDAGQVRRLSAQQKSLMPDLLLRDMTAQQVADLLAYLESLR